MKAVVAAFNQEKALVGAFSVITNLRMELFGALLDTHCTEWWLGQIVMNMNCDNNNIQQKSFGAEKYPFSIIEMNEMVIIEYF